MCKLIIKSNEKIPDLFLLKSEGMLFHVPNRIRRSPTPGFSSREPTKMLLREELYCLFFFTCPDFFWNTLIEGSTKPCHFEL